MARRIQAARDLSGIKQADLDALVEEDIGRKDVTGRLERYLTKPERSLPPFTMEVAECIARHTGLPVGWFTEPELGNAFLPESDLRSRVDEIETQQAEGLAGLDEVRSEIGLALQRLERVEHALADRRKRPPS